MNARCYAKPSFYTTLDKTPVNTYPPSPQGQCCTVPDFLLNIDIGGRGGKSVHGVLSNVVFTAEIGYPLYRTAARQEIRVTDVLPREAHWPTMTLGDEEVFKPSYSSFKNNVFRHVSDARVRNKSRLYGPPKGFLCVGYALSLFLKPLRLKGLCLMKILMSRFCSGI